MKVILQNEDHCRVVTVKDSDIDLNRHAPTWVVRTEVDFAGTPVRICITGYKLHSRYDENIDYTVPATIDVLGEEDSALCLEYRSPLIRDEHTSELFPMTPDELIRRMAQVAVPLIPDPRFLRDFSYHDAAFVRRTGAKHPFLWLVRECGTYLYDLTGNDDASGMQYTMEQYRDKCCMFHYDGCTLKPITPQAAWDMLEKLNDK